MRQRETASIEGGSDICKESTIRILIAMLVEVVQPQKESLEPRKVVQQRRIVSNSCETDFEYVQNAISMSYDT